MTKRTRSGEHPAVQAHRAKMDSIEEFTLPEIEAAGEKITRSITPAPPLPEEEIPVELEEPDPFPEKKP